MDVILIQLPYTLPDRKMCCRVNTYDEYLEITEWMRSNDIDYDMLSSGAKGYRFSVNSNFEWFLLRWL